MNTLGERIRRTRKAKGLSQIELSSLSGVRQSSLSAIEDGSTKSPRNLLEIAIALQVDPSWLKFGAGEEPSFEPKQPIPVAHKAHRYVNKAIRDGYLPCLTTLVCADCGSQAQVYDHRDYSKPLEVEPVCHSCNVRRGPALSFKHAHEATTGDET